MTGAKTKFNFVFIRFRFLFAIDCLLLSIPVQMNSSFLSERLLFDLF